MKKMNVNKTKEKILKLVQKIHLTLILMKFKNGSNVLKNKKKLKHVLWNSEILVVLQLRDTQNPTETLAQLVPLRKQTHTFQEVVMK